VEGINIFVHFILTQVNLHKNAMVTSIHNCKGGRTQQNCDYIIQSHMFPPWKRGSWNVKNVKTNYVNNLVLCVSFSFFYPPAFLPFNCCYTIGLKINIIFQLHQLTFQCNVRSYDFISNWIFRAFQSVSLLISEQEDLDGIKNNISFSRFEFLIQFYVQLKSQAEPCRVDSIKLYFYKM
jgi:hypothetical protein